jgi:hypothetical protein
MNTIEIIQDDNAVNPRQDFDNFGRMVCWTRRYSLGDDQPSGDPQDYLSSLPKGSVVLPLYLYDHSGITMKTTPFSCQWDSGQVGFIFVTPEKIREEFGVKRITKNLREKCKTVLISEVATYDAYISGEVYIIVEKDDAGNVVDSCGGYYGFESAKEEAKRIQDQLKTGV